MSTIGTNYDDPALGGEAIARDRARELLGRVMGFVAVAVGCAALGAYLGRDLGGVTGLLLFIRRVRVHHRPQHRGRQRPRATRDRTPVWAGPPARTCGRPRHRLLRRGRSVLSLAGGRSHRSVRRGMRPPRCNPSYTAVIGMNIAGRLAEAG
jgi:hypothetical protein